MDTGAGYPMPSTGKVATMPAARAELIHEMAAALERADASARILGARARAARAGAGPAAAFSALATAGPGGLVPPVGTGGALAARHLEHAALAAAAAGPVLPHDVVEALAHAAAEARRQSAGANALDPRGVARAVRREVAAVRGLAAHSMPRNDVWETMRLGTFLPRAAWMTALLLACVRVAAADPASASAVWHAAALVAGAHAGDPPPAGEVLPRLLADETVPVTVAYSANEVAGSLFSLSRRAVAGAAPLALARATGKPRNPQRPRHRSRAPPGGSSRCNRCAGGERRAIAPPGRCGHRGGRGLTDGLSIT